MRIRNLAVALIMIITCMISCKVDKPVRDGDTLDVVVGNVVSTTAGGVLELANGPGDQTYFLVRHAEKDTVPAGNPVLTAEGYQRASKLATILEGVVVDRVYSTFYNRTLHTVDSLATLKGVKTNIYTPAKMKQVAEELTADEDVRTVVIAGHSNTIPGMANVLMDSMILKQNIDESDYGNFYIVNINNESGQRSLYQLRY